MKIQVVSDLHLEFNTNLTVDNAGADVLILSGDICIADHLYSNPTAGITDMIQNGWHANDAQRYRKFFDHISKQFEIVFYIMGNHEHYHGQWNRTAEIMRETFEPYNNIHLLDNEWINLDGIRFAGTTLWTDLNRRDPITVHAIKDMMNDYKTITIKNDKGQYHKLRPIDTINANAQAIEFIKLAYETWKGPVVVIGHHGPTMLSCHESYRGDYIMNGAFYNDLYDYIESCDRIKLWTHGHTHRASDYVVGSTRIVCNPHGYPGEFRDYNPNLVVEI